MICLMLMSLNLKFLLFRFVAQCFSFFSNDCKKNIRCWACSILSPASGSALKISPAFCGAMFLGFLPLATFHQLRCPIPYGLWVVACFCPSVFLAVRTTNRGHPAPRKPKQGCVSVKMFTAINCLTFIFLLSNNVPHQGLSIKKKKKIS